MKAVFFDIDGTLFDLKSHQILPSTFEGLKQLKENGYKIGIATARPFKLVRTIPNLLDVEWDGIVCGNGMEIRDSSYACIKKEALSKDTLQNIFSIAEEHDIPIFATGMTTMVTRMNDDVETLFSRYHISDYTIKPYTGEDVQLITVVSYQKELVTSMFKEVSNIKLVDGGDLNTDIFPRFANKVQGIHTLMHYWGLDIHAYMTFGDSKSDEAMIQDAQIGIAMGNAMESTKKCADYICPSSDQEGIYGALKHFKMI